MSEEDDLQAKVDGLANAFMAMSMALIDELAGDPKSGRYDRVYRRIARSANDHADRVAEAMAQEHGEAAAQTARRWTEQLLLPFLPPG